MPGRSHSGVAPKMPKGAWTGSPGGTTHSTGINNWPRTASGRMQVVFSRNANSREEPYPRDKYFLITPDDKPHERQIT
jgi:hypothetical protein